MPPFILGPYFLFALCVLSAKENTSKKQIMKTSVVFMKSEHSDLLFLAQCAALIHMRTSFIYRIDRYLPQYLFFLAAVTTMSSAL